MTTDNTADTVTLSLAEDTGRDNSDGITQDTTVNITGLESTSTFEYSLDGGANWITGTGSSFELAENATYADGDVLVRTTDIAGNISAPVSIGAVTTDNTAPTSAPTITVIGGDEDNSNETDLIVSDTTPTILGSAEAGSTVSITYTDSLGNSYTDTAIASSTGEYSITLSHALEENSVTSLTLTSTDAAGNVSPSITQNITVDTSADNDNIPFELMLEASDLDGVNAEEAANIVLGLEGIDSDAASVEVVFSDNNDATEDVVVHASQAADGTWSIADADISGLTNGNINVTATVTDIAGNIATDTHTVILNRDIPDAPTIEIIEDNNNDGILVNNEIINEDLDVTIEIPDQTPDDGILTVTTTGRTLSAENTLHLAINDNIGINNYQEITTDTTSITDGGYSWNVDFSIDASGTWTLILTTDSSSLAGETLQFEYQEIPEEGDTFTVSASITDSFGNRSNLSTDSVIRADETAPGAPIVTITEDTNNDGVVSGTELSGQVDVNITLPTDVVAGDMLNITNPDSTVSHIMITDTMISNGYTTVYDAPAEGETITISATVTDASDNTSTSASDSITVDTIADENSDLSISLTDANTLLLSGIDSDIQSIVINDGDDEIATITYDTASDEWSSSEGTYHTNTGIFTLNTALLDGAHTLETTVTDDAGNTATSPSYTSYLGTANDDTLTVSSTNQYDSIDLGAGTDTLIISDSVTIDLSNVSNVETFNVGTDTSLVGSGTDGALTLEDLGLTSSNDTIVLSDTNDTQDNGSIKIDKSAFTDTDNDGTPDRTETDSNSDGTIDYYSYTTSDGGHTIQIDATIDVSWQ